MSRDWNIIDDEPSEAAPPPPASDGLDTRRIRSIVMERRAAHRARLRAVLTPFACAAVAGMAVVRAIATRETHPMWALMCLAIAAGAAWVGIRAAITRRPLAADLATEPPALPDFSALPAGRSAAERLAEMDRFDP